MRNTLVSGLAVVLAGSLPAADQVDYTHDIKPLLSAHCTECHGSARQRAGLRLDSAAAIREGGNSGPAIVVGKSADSRLIHAVTGTHDAALMPPKGPRLTSAQIALLAHWINQGAVAPREEATAPSGPTRPTHWSFQPVKRPEVPSVRDGRGVVNPIDRFIRARLDAARLTPSPEADRPTLIRRLSLDLIGLPPTPAEVDAFLADPSPDAYERLVERLLASPHYGERWGRVWLDQARYADSNGFNIDAARSIWPYRDWVIATLNRDQPFDQFTIEQLAGDLLPGATREQLVATGFHRNTLLNQEGGIDVEQFRVESVVDRVNTTGAVWLGLTVGCAQCHDHKFDPLSQREFYQLFAFLNGCDEPTLELPTPADVKRRAEVGARVTELERRLAGIDPVSPAVVEFWERKLSPEARLATPAEIQHILGTAINGRDERQERTLRQFVRDRDKLRHVVGGLAIGPLPAVVHAMLITERTGLEKRIDAEFAKLPAIPTTLVMRERETPRETYVMLGGDFTRKGVTVTAGTPASLPALKAGSSRTRLDLARWLVDPANPLTARVTVNRLWMHHFGIGLVETENDFGTQGTPPSHPELLDWLADEFIRQGWSLKAMHRLIVTSATYRQSSKARPELATVDARNRLLARMPRLRLEAELVRDNALAASGLLSPRFGGPTVFPPQPEGVFRVTQIQRQWKPSVGPDRYRRGLYTHLWRSSMHPALTVFDAPESTTTCTRRNRSNTPLQALTLLNDAAMHEIAGGLARRIAQSGEPTNAGKVRYAFRVCLARDPSPTELSRLARFAAESGDWLDVARVLMNLDEFITRE